MIDSLLIVFLFVAGIIGMLAAFILIFINANNKVTRFLGFHLFIVSFEALYVVAWLNHTILIIPHIYRMDHPLLILNAAALYFYFREVFTKKKFSLAKEYWHLLPALFIIIYHYQDYMAGTETKNKLIDSIIKVYNPVPIDLHPEEYCIVAIASSSIIYSYLNWRLYKNFLKQDLATQESLHTFLKWVKSFIKIALFNLTAFVLASLIVEANIVSNNLVQIVLGVHILTISLTLFTNPHILYGLNEPKSLLGVMEIEKGNSDKALLTPAQIESYNAILDDYLSQNPFLKSSYSQKIMSEEANIPVHHISYLINNHYRMNYNDFINKLRIEFVINNAKTGKWDNYSVEGIAHEVGFKSKTTFISSFKKITGTTPSNYLFNPKENTLKRL